jgi:hypothetical protein
LENRQLREGEQRENNWEMKTFHFHIEIKVISQIAWGSKL